MAAVNGHPVLRLASPVFAIPKPDDIVGRRRLPRSDPFGLAATAVRASGVVSFEPSDIARSSPQLDRAKAAGRQHVSCPIECQRLDEVTVSDPRSRIGRGFHQSHDRSASSPADRWERDKYKSDWLARRPRTDRHESARSHKSD